MSTFRLRLEKTYYEKGFFNVTVDHDSPRFKEGPITLFLVNTGESLEGRVDLKANPNGTPRIMGGAKLRGWFQANFKVGDVVQLEVNPPKSIRLGTNL